MCAMENTGLSTLRCLRCWEPMVDRRPGPKITLSQLRGRNDTGVAYIENAITYSINHCVSSYTSWSRKRMLVSALGS